MIRVVASTAFFVCFSIVANADDPAALPKDVPPVVGTAFAIPSDAGGDKWSIKLTVPKVRWEIIGEERPKADWPRFKVSAEDASLTLSMAYHPVTQLNEIAQNRILDLMGKRLRREDAFKRLATSKPVLVSVSGRMPDAYYLQTTKPNTLIVVLGIPSAPAPDLLTQPANSSKGY